MRPGAPARNREAPGEVSGRREFAGDRGELLDETEYRSLSIGEVGRRRRTDVEINRHGYFVRGPCRARRPRP